MSSTKYIDWMEETESSPEYAAELAKIEFAVSLERIMKTEGVSKKELAGRLGTSPAAVTMALRGDANLTIDRMVKMAHALGAKMHINVARNDCKVVWREVYTNKEEIEAGMVWARTTNKEGGRELKRFAG